MRIIAAICHVNRGTSVIPLPESAARTEAQSFRRRIEDLLVLLTDCNLKPEFLVFPLKPGPSAACPTVTDMALSHLANEVILKRVTLKGREPRW
jgi:hypothetical protein